MNAIRLRILGCFFIICYQGLQAQAPPWFNSPPTCKDPRFVYAVGIGQDSDAGRMRIRAEVDAIRTYMARVHGIQIDDATYEEMVKNGAEKIMFRGRPVQYDVRCQKSDESRKNIFYTLLVFPKSFQPEGVRRDIEYPPNDIICQGEPPPPYEPSPPPQNTFGMCFGLNFTNMFVSPSLDNTKMIPGGQFGAVYEASLEKKYACQVGLLYVTQGFEFEGSFMGFTKGILNLSYLCMPITFMFKFNPGDMTPFLQGKYYWGLAVEGKIKEAEGVEEKVKFGKDAILNRFDYGFGLGFGMQIGEFQGVIEGNIGINISNVDKFSIQNTGIALTLTYMFGKNK